MAHVATCSRGRVGAAAMAGGRLGRGRRRRGPGACGGPLRLLGDFPLRDAAGPMLSALCLCGFACTFSVHVRVMACQCLGG